MKPEQKIVRNPDFIFRMILDEGILIPIRKDVADLDSIFTLNDVGASIWQQLEQPHTIEDIQTKLLDEYDVDPQILQQDLQSYLEDMLKINALRMI